MRRRADALFELTDAVLTAGLVPSPPHLSLAPVHRRGWCSLYAALAKGRIDDGDARELLARHPLAEGGSPVYAVDVSPWPKCDAEASPERRYLYHPSKHSAGQPIVAGWAYQVVAQLGFVFDAGCDPVRLQVGLEKCRAQILVRLHSGRTFYAEPELPPKRPVGRPLRHGAKFSCKDPDTWPRPTAEHFACSADYGSVRIRAWSGLHPKTRRAAERYGATTAAVVEGTVVLVEVERLPRGERRRKPKVMWLWWTGEGEPNLVLLWRAYCRRFDVEHFVKFLKGALGWTTPRVRHPEQADRWTWLVLPAYAQLLIARRIVADRRLPWERPLPAGSLTPTRVLRNFAALLSVVGTPAEAPKPRGRSPGRPKGNLSGPAKRYPVLKRAA